MKVLHVLHSIERSGAEVMLVQAAPVFHGHRVESHLLSTGDSLGRYAPALADAGFTLHHLPFRASSSYLLQYWRLLRQERFDVIHIHTEQAFFWYGLLARLAGVNRLVHTVHNVFDFHGALWAERWLQRRVARWVLREQTVAVSPSVQQAEERIYGLRPALILNWTDPDRFSPAVDFDTRLGVRGALGMADTALVYVSVGSCQGFKNHAGIIRALAAIRTACPGAHYLHVGSGELEGAEKELAESLDLRDFVTFASQRDDIPEVLRASDVFVMPSTHEGLGNSCLEAMSCGLPVIATDVAGLRDLVVDGETGRLVRSADELAQAMAELYENSELRAVMGKNGRERVLVEFSLERSVKEYLGLYRG